VIGYSPRSPKGEALVAQSPSLSPRMLNRETVMSVATCYPPNEEAKDDKVFGDDFRKPILARGYLIIEDILRIADWKSPRPKPRILENNPNLVRVFTQQAFEEPDVGEAVRKLDQLRGVGVRMASAILTAYDPSTFTVLDHNAWLSLEQMEYVQSPTRPLEAHLDRSDTYPPYLRVCRRLATSLNVSLRTLDRCLWTLKGRTPAEFFAERARKYR
jgi:hypothetical protein